jgi:hypothetical protein
VFQASMLERGDGDRAFTSEGCFVFVSVRR